MMLTSVPSAAATELDAPVTVRLIGMLDRVLVENFADAFAGLAASGTRNCIILVRDLVAMRDENLNRFFATLESYRAQGHRISIDATPTWRKVVRGLGTRFEQTAPRDGRATRRQLIICHSLDKRGAA